MVHLFGEGRSLNPESDTSQDHSVIPAGRKPESSVQFKRTTPDSRTNPSVVISTKGRIHGLFIYLDARFHGHDG